MRKPLESARTRTALGPSESADEKGPLVGTRSHPTISFDGRKKTASIGPNRPRSRIKLHPYDRNWILFAEDEFACEKTRIGRILLSCETDIRARLEPFESVVVRRPLLEVMVLDRSSIPFPRSAPFGSGEHRRSGVRRGGPLETTSPCGRACVTDSSSAPERRQRSPSFTRPPRRRSLRSNRSSIP